MKKRSILTVLVALFLVSLISCTDSNTGGDNSDNGDGSGGLNYTPELEKDNESTFNLGYYIRGEGMQKSLFNKCYVLPEDIDDPAGSIAMICHSHDNNLPVSTALKMQQDPVNTRTYTISNANTNMFICFNYSSSVNKCTDTVTITSKNNGGTINSRPISVGVNPNELEKLKTDKIPELTGFFDVSSTNPVATNRYYYKIKFIDTVTADCMDGVATGTAFCSSTGGKFVLNNDKPVAGFSVWDYLTIGSKRGHLKNLKIEFAQDFFTIFEIDGKTTCKIVNNLLSVDKNCDIFIKKKSGVSGEKSMKIIHKPTSATSITQEYIFISE